jgi:hypothetical protein
MLGCLVDKFTNSSNRVFTPATSLFDELMNFTQTGDKAWLVCGTVLEATANQIQAYQFRVYFPHTLSCGWWRQCQNSVLTIGLLF